MKNQALFSSKDKSEKLKCRLLQFSFGALRVKSMCCCIKFRAYDSKLKYFKCDNKNKTSFNSSTTSPVVNLVI